MGNVSSYHRPPLMDTAFAPVPDASVSIRGNVKNTIDQVLRMVNRGHLSAMDAVLCTKLGGYKSTPALPEKERPADSITDLSAFTQYWRAAEMIALMNHDRDGITEILAEMHRFKNEMKELSEGELLENGAELFRLTLDLYRRTGKSFLCDLMKELRSRLPDVSGVMRSFPFQTLYTPSGKEVSQDERSYHERMDRLATTRITADSVALTALIAQYSGDRRDTEAPKLGYEQLRRYHMLPGGAVSGDPYLSGRNPSETAVLQAISAQMEAWYDAFLLKGDVCFAEAMELLYENVLCDMITKETIRPCFAANRLPSDETCRDSSASDSDVSAMVRALYAYRRSVWLKRTDSSVCLNQPVSAGCYVHVNNQELHLFSEVKDEQNRTVSVTVDCREPVEFELCVRIPGYCGSAEMCLNGHEIQPGFENGYATLKRTFIKGDCITVKMQLGIHTEKGWRDMTSVYYGPWLMALPVQKDQHEWRFALKCSEEPLLRSAADRTVAVLACGAEQWKVNDGLIGIPPRDVKAGEYFALTLCPAAGLGGRISAFPCVVEK